VPPDHWQLSGCGGRILPAWVSYARKEMLDEAMLQFQRASKIDSNMAVIYNSIGLIYYKRHNLEEAIESFQIEIDLNLQSVSAHVNLGRTYSSWQNLDGALDQYLWPLRSNLS